MKTFLGVLFSLIVLFTVCTPGQTNSTWQHYFTSNASSDSVVAYKLYVEKRSTNTGFIMQDGMEYTTALDQFDLNADMLHTVPGIEMTYNQVFQNNGQYFRFGVIAYSVSGVKSVLSVSDIYKVDKQPSKPGGVGSRKLN